MAAQATSKDDVEVDIYNLNDTAPAANGTPLEMSRDEHHLATLGYKQTFIRSFGLFENWAATFTTMNFTNGLPGLFGFAMYTGGPQAALANWCMVGGLSTIVALAMAEIAAALPTAGGIYYWAYRLGGKSHGPLLAWLTAWFNWAGWIAIMPGVAQGNTNFLLGAIAIQWPENTLVSKGWFSWCLSCCVILIGLVPNVTNQRTIKTLLRGTAYSALLLIAFYWIWFPIAASRRKGFQSSKIFSTFVNGINLGVDAQGNVIQEASDSYCWVIGLLFGAWEFYGYDASVHLAEETKQASTVVAKGMWLGSAATWLASVPTLVLILFCMQDLDSVINGSFANNWAQYLLDLVGPNGATAILVFIWLDGCLSTAVCFLSAQRITYAIARDGVLPFSNYFSQVSEKRHLPRNAAYLVAFLGIAINAAVIGSTVAFTALTATATIATNFSYLIPIVARHTVGRSSFQPAKWNLGVLSIPITIVAAGYISFLFIVLMLPQLYPVTRETFNYAPVMIVGIGIIALGGWFFPFGLGGRNWFNGPKKTISDADIATARIKEDYDS
ncbi:amino acid or gaba permease [Polychaeton citri CBS 116435]|uniref:Amino acid or gaba permease n=1 Tax=Polychaeton citri CBS 116435 TaxID=1314669 RepID=A0A9P4QAL3_9PEZI|nr:amino acid or gaba permease [Polychaeton citri CBS 116435]